MSESNETSAAILTRLFQATDAPLGQEWLDSVESGWTDSSLHSLVVTSGTISAAKAKELYGHFRTKTQMKSIPGPYWLKDPVTSVTTELARLNRTTATVESRLLQLRTDKVGAILLVTTTLDEAGVPSDPFITIVGAPSMATHMQPYSDNGVLYEDVWDPSVMANFQPDLTMDDSHCPLLGAQQGFTRATKLKPGMFHLLQETQPLFFPAGELTCTTVMSKANTYLRTIFLPEVCNFPLGMRWPIDIGYDDFKRSIQGALGASGAVFQKILNSMQEQLESWFTIVEIDAKNFKIPSCPFLLFYDDNYPGIDNGEWPETIIDREGFSPLLDMMNGYLWRLWCDRMLTTESPVNRRYMNIFLQIGDRVEKKDTYLGADIPGRFCPNFAHHFRVTNGWPTDTATSSFLREFLHPPLISHQANQYDPVEVDLHQPELTLDVFKTREERMSATHQSKTPRTSAVLKPLASPSSRTPKPPTPREVRKGNDNPLPIPSEVKPFSPVASSPRRTTITRAPLPTQRSLEAELQGNLPIAKSAPITALKPILIFNLQTGTIYIEEGRRSATDTFLNVCRLLAHHSTTRSLMVERIPIPLDALIYAREPCGLFRREILAHHSKMTGTGGFMPSFLSFMEAILRPAQIQLSGIYDPNFFSGAFLHAFLSVESWMVSDYMLPANVPPATFHVYRLIGCLQKFAKNPLLLPGAGLTLLEAKQIGILTYYLFAMMDLSDDGKFSDRKFVGSILGRRLKTWSQLPDSAMVHGLWNKAPLQATYQWFSSLQTLLGIEQNWVKRLRYHPERGFYHARDTDGRLHLLLDNQVPSNIPGRTDSLPDALRQFDNHFEMRWFCGSFLDPIWSADIPDGHSAMPVQSNKHSYTDTNTDQPETAVNKRIRLAGGKIKIPDFISSTPLMIPVVSLPANCRSTTMALVRRIQAPVPFPRLPSTNGTLQTLCLNSAFPQPYNCCVLRLCGDKKSNPRTPRLHIDLNQEPWSSKPEAYWAPMVAFLMHEQVRPHIRPSTALKLKTPGTQWP